MMIISVHVPKCAGTSFRHVIDSIYGAEIWYNYGPIFSKDQARLELIPPGTRMIHGHFFADSFDDILPDRTLLTWVRHPVERLVSNYFHFLRAPDMRDDCCRALHEQNLGLRAFADLDWMRNMATRYLANKPVAAFQFVGVSEYFEASIRQFCQVYGCQTVGALPRVNINPDRTTESYGLTAADRDYIAERNQVDMAWYEEALARHRDAGFGSSSHVA